MKYLLDIQAMYDLIDMYLEYRDKHGYTHAHARAAAILETTDPDAGYMVNDGDGHELDAHETPANTARLEAEARRLDADDQRPARQPRGL